MAYSTINPNSIEVGDPVRKELLDKIKANADDHETRINNIESSAKKINIFKFLLMNASSFSTATGIAYYKAEDTFTITKAAFQIFEKGTLAGSVEIDIKKSTTTLDGVSFTSIFTTKPKIDYATAVDYQETTNQVFDLTKINIVPGDYLRLDITSTPSNTGVLPKILLNIYGE